MKIGALAWWPNSDANLSRRPMHHYDVIGDELRASANEGLSHCGFVIITDCLFADALVSHYRL
jgi:hypothetical protein